MTFLWSRWWPRHRDEYLEHVVRSLVTALRSDPWARQRVRMLERRILGEHPTSALADDVRSDLGILPRDGE